MDIDLVNEKWYWVRYEGIGRTYEAPPCIKAMLVASTAMNLLESLQGT